MKTKLLFFLLLIFPIFISAQDEELTNDIWYLHSVKLNDVTFENPNLLESYAFLWFGENTVFSEMCITGGVYCDFVINENQISLSEVNTFPGDCEDAESVDFREAYYEVIAQNSPFSYTINSLEENIKESIWTDSEGNELYFTNRPFYNPAPDELVQNNWYLHYAKIDDVIHYTPNNDEVSSVVLHINDYSFYTSVCAPLDGSFGFVPQSDDFYILDMAEGLSECNPYDGNNTFQDLYHGFFWTNRYEVLEYEFTQNSDETSSLIITDSEGNQLVYGNLEMSTLDYNADDLKLFPNPVDNLLSIQNSNPKNNQIFIFDLNGKMILNQNLIVGTNEINVQNLPKGMYVVQIKSSNQIIKAEKIIKN